MVYLSVHFALLGNLQRLGQLERDVLKGGYVMTQETIEGLREIIKSLQTHPDLFDLTVIIQRSVDGGIYRCAIGEKMLMDNLYTGLEPRFEAGVFNMLDGVGYITTKLSMQEEGRLVSFLYRLVARKIIVFSTRKRKIPPEALAVFIQRVEDFIASESNVLESPGVSKSDDL